MQRERLVVEFERDSDGAVVLHLAGRLEHATASLVDGILLALRSIPLPVVVDLAGVGSIDADGLGVLLRAEQEALRAGAAIEITGVRESLQERRPPVR